MISTVSSSAAAVEEPDDGKPAGDEAGRRTARVGVVASTNTAAIRIA